jgi:hypothetical protein
MTTLRYATLAALLALPAAALADPSCAVFDSQTLRFAGTPQQQAACLVRGLHVWGRLDHKPTTLPGTLRVLVGEKVDISAARYRTWLQTQGIAEADIGGSLDERLARGNSDAADAPTAGYFVIHDTSTPNIGKAAFPADMDSASWSFNSLKHAIRGKPVVLPGCVKSADPENQPVAHVFINRLGESVSPVDFSIPWRATKFESKNDCHAKGLFLHTELIEPRRSDPLGHKGNDAVAPLPGFTEAQYRRLAIVYIAASIRKGSWMVPSFHATLDEGISDGHDDPQNFSIYDWAAARADVLRELEAGAATHS